MHTYSLPPHYSQYQLCMAYGLLREGELGSEKVIEIDGFENLMTALDGLLVPK